MNSNEHLVVPAGVKEIPAQFFNNAQNVTSVSLPATVETIGQYAFFNMPKVQTLVLPPSVTSVGTDAFGCSGVDSMLFYNSGFSLPHTALNSPTTTTALAYTVEGTQDGKTAVKITSASKAATVCNNAMGDNYVISGVAAGVPVTLTHDWDEGTITTPATCTAPGVKTFTCRHNAEHTKTEEVPIVPDAHEWDEGTITTPATCTAPGVKTFTCTHDGKHSRTEDVAFLGHDLSDAVISEPTAEKLGEVHRMCSRGDYDVFSHYTLGDGASPTMYPDGTRISDASYTPKAGGPFNFNGQEIEILLQDPLGVLGSGELGLTVRQTDLPATFDGDVPVEHQHSYDIIPTVNGLEKSGKLSNKVRLLYKIPQGWDRHDLEVFLAQAGEDREFDEVTEKIGNDEYLVVWTDHFSPYVFVDKLNPEEKAELEALQAADGSRGDSNTPQNGALLTTDSPQGDSGNGQTNGDHSIKTGDASGEILMLSTLAMIATGLYLGALLKSDTQCKIETWIKNLNARNTGAKNE